MRDYSPTLAERLWNRATKGGDDECWLWAGKPANGYGELRFGGQLYLAHRVSYELAYGAIPDGLQLHHTCGVRLCVNPSHLIALTVEAHARRP